MEPPNNLGQTPPLVNEEVLPEAVRVELRNVLRSRHFRSSKRSQQFLEFVVEQKLVGNELLIKERLIGIEVFGRSVDYATGDDPVVRVQASEVRRRLDAYRMDCQEAGLVTIELPTGTYVPVFRQGSPWANGESLAPLPSAGDLAPSLELQSIPPTPPENLGVAGTAAPSPHWAAFPRWSFRRGLWGCTLLVCGALVGRLSDFPQQRPDVITKFWGPVLSSKQSVVICLGSPAFYVPAPRLYDLPQIKANGGFDRMDDRRNKFLPLDKSTAILWGDLVPGPKSGPGVEGVRAGLAIAAFLGQAGKAFNTRFGEEGSFTDLRDSPAVIVGNRNNRWTTDLEDDLPLRFHQSSDGEDIEEAGTNRSWGIGTSGEVYPDYGLITREPVGITGSFLLKISGIRGAGTEAASELVTRPDLLQNAVASLPPNWEKKNLQILVMTQSIGQKASSPKVVAVHVW